MGGRRIGLSCSEHPWRLPLDLDREGSIQNVDDYRDRIFVTSLLAPRREVPKNRRDLIPKERKLEWLPGKRGRRLQQGPDGDAGE